MHSRAYQLSSLDRLSVRHTLTEQDNLSVLITSLASCVGPFGYQVNDLENEDVIFSLPFPNGINRSNLFIELSKLLHMLDPFAHILEVPRLFDTLFTLFKCPVMSLEALTCRKHALQLAMLVPNSSDWGDRLCREGCTAPLMMLLLELLIEADDPMLEVPHAVLLSPILVRNFEQVESEDEVNCPLVRLF